METVARLKVHIQLRGSAVSRKFPVFELLETQGNSNLGDGRHHAVDCVEALIVCHVSSATGRSIAGDSVARV
jgi:hypothetical protein